MKKNIPRLLSHVHVLCFLFANLLALGAIAQVKISGKVSGADGQPLPAITVAIRNNNLATASDAEGNYTLSGNLKPGNYTLLFTGIGFTSNEQAIRISNESSYTINARLNGDALGLDEVIVTGTSQGTTRRQLGSYISTVKGDQLTRGATGNVLAALQGKTAGAQITQNSGDPAGGISVRLRGISSINSSS